MRSGADVLSCGVLLRYIYFFLMMLVRIRARVSDRSEPTEALQACSPIREARIADDRAMMEFGSLVSPHQ
jgi:hypothetical protein